jgi:D-sedoheptulose 7-phosphate isomerase
MTMLREFTDSYFQGLNTCYAEVSREKLERIVDILLDAYRHGRKFFILGNGGSATTATHMACDFGKGTVLPGKPRLRVVSLSDNMALITAWANDASYEVVFKEQLANLLEPGDVVLGISASGNSPNVLRAMEYAKQHGAVTLGFVGFGGGKLKDLVDVDITVSSRNYGQVEDLHLTLNHIVSQYLKERFAVS